MNALPEVKASGGVYRLPTADEWEFACRAGATGDYCKLADGTEITEKTLGEVAWFRDNSGCKYLPEEPHPVGQKKPNAFGLYDMCGNVREWTSSHDLFFVVDRRLICGGSCVSNAGSCEENRTEFLARCRKIGRRVSRFCGMVLLEPTDSATGRPSKVSPPRWMSVPASCTHANLSGVDA